MAQRWMTAKIQLGKMHGFTASGASRPTGKVGNDRDYGFPRMIVDDRPSKPRKPCGPTILKAERGKPFRAKGTPRR